MKRETELIHNRAGAPDRRTVNPPVERASTVILPDRRALYNAQPGYGRMGLSVHRELEAALAALEGAKQVRLTPSGLSACAVAAAAVVEAGDTILVSDCIYGPTRRFCERRLQKMGVTAKRFHPGDTAGIEALLDDRVKAIFLESPGSLTFDISDTRAIVDMVSGRGIRTIMDNTWSAGVFCQPLDLGVDISVQALTKYVIGHADGFGGAVMTRDRTVAASVEAVTEDWGICIGPEEAYVALRGTRSLHTRLRQHQQGALKLAGWLKAQDGVLQVLHPALPSHPDHALWQRDFSGSSGLFSFMLNAECDEEVDAFLNALDLFALGFSWGGFESLVIPCDEQLTRLPGDWTEGSRGRLLRLHAGLEDVDDLIEDLSRGFAALHEEKNS